MQYRKKLRLSLAIVTAVVAVAGTSGTANAGWRINLFDFSSGAVTCTDNRVWKQSSEGRPGIGAGIQSSTVGGTCKKNGVRIGLEAEVLMQVRPFRWSGYRTVKSARATVSTGIGSRISTVARRDCYRSSTVNNWRSLGRIKAGGVQSGWKSSGSDHLRCN